MIMNPPTNPPAIAPMLMLLLSVADPVVVVVPKEALVDEE
jgi:hypothetical protein